MGKELFLFVGGEAKKAIIQMRLADGFLMKN